MTAWKQEEASSGPTDGAGITVRVVFLGEIRGLAGKRNMEITVSEGSTLQDLLVFVSQKLGDGFARRLFKSEGVLHHSVALFMNGDEIRGPEGLRTELIAGQIDIFMLPQYSGG